jgi:hypothetical protein
MTRVVLRGTIRVDARRARAKLREHLLVDLSSYTLEIARAASALGGETLEIRWDADDVELAFDGAAIARERLERLLDFALVEEADDTSRALRKLALGVNAAIGLGAEWVDVSSHAKDAAWRVRWTRKLLAEGDAEQDLDNPAIAVDPSTLSFSRGVCVHVRRRLGLDVLHRAVFSDAPREVTLLAEHTHTCPLAISVNGAPVLRSPRPAALARVPVTLPECRDAWVEVLPAGSDSRIELVERGVRLLDLVWAPIPPAAGRSTPLRLVANSDELPTNASRSALREDSPLALSLRDAGDAAVDRAIAALVARVIGQGTVPEGVEIPDGAEHALEDALGAIALVAFEAARSGRALTPRERALLTLPLLHGAGGGRIALGHALAAPRLHVWKGEEALPEELSPWLTDVVWLRGRHVEQALELVELTDAADLIKRARVGAARRRRHLSRPAGAPAVPKSDLEITRGPFRFEQGPFAGLHGEVALRPSAPTSTVRVFVEERLLDSITLEASICPLTIDAAIAWPEGLRPRYDYDAIERDDQLSHALYATSHAALGLAEAMAGKLDETRGEEREKLADVLTDAIAAFSVMPEKLGFTPPTPESFRKTFPHLFSARVLRTTDPKRRASLEEIAEYVQRTKALCMVESWRADAGTAAPDERPVLVGEPSRIRTVLAAIGGKVQVVPYVPASGWQADLPDRRRETLERAASDERVRSGASARGPRLWLERGGALTLVTPALYGSTVEAHRGVVLRVRQREADKLPVIVASDDVHTVPSPDWSDALYVPPRSHWLIEKRFVERLVAALSGDATAIAEVGGLDTANRDLSLVVLLVEFSAIVSERIIKRRMRASEQALTTIRTELEELPLLVWLDESGRPEATSIARVAAKHGSSVPLLEAPPGFPTLDWHPVLAAHPRERAALARRFTNAALAVHELASRAARVEQYREKDALLTQPALDADDTGQVIAKGDQVIHLAPSDRDTTGADLDVLAGLPHAALDFTTPWVLVRYRGRPIAGLVFRDLELPLAACVDSAEDEDFEAWSHLSRSGLVRVLARLRQAGMELGNTLAKSALGPGASSRILADVRAVLLLRALLEQRLGDAVESMLAGGQFFWPTIQGGEARMSELAKIERTLWVGRERYPEWKRRENRESELDRPTLHVPVDASANATCALLESLGHSLFDVTTAAAGLQAERSGAGSEAPRLLGSPVHAAARASLAELGVAWGDGEVELAEGPKTTVTLLLLGGARTEIELDLPCALRVVLRVETFDQASVQAKLAEALVLASRTLLERAAHALCEMPAFARRNARRLVLARLGKDAALEALPVFEDTAGGWHSLAEIVAAGQWRFTTLDPPFSAQSEACLCLRSSDASMLSNRLQLVLADDVIERERKAEQRRSAAPRVDFMLSQEQRAASVVTAAVHVAGATGEVGVLAPGHVALRGVELHTAGRPLCRLSDGPGFPIIACVNDDSIAPDRWFEAPASPKDASAVVDRVRDVARAALKRMFSPPATALAARWLEDVPMGSNRVTGSLWLASSFPTAPQVRVYTAFQAAPLSRALEVAAAGRILPVLPVEGDLLVRCTPKNEDDAATLNERLAALDIDWNALAELGKLGALALLADARSRGVSQPALEEHAWSLALLGLDAAPTPARALDGREIGPHEILEELATKGALWLGDGRGFTEGQFPGVSPGFVLPAENSALCRVLRARFLPGTVRMLGGVRAPLPEADAERTNAALDLEPEAPGDAAGVWASLQRRLESVFSPSEIEQADLPELEPLRRRVAALGLTGSPVDHVRPARQRRAMRYDRKKKLLLVSPDHAAVRPLLARLASDPRALRALAAAAVAEINRALSEVTDAEERRVLAGMLDES